VQQDDGVLDLTGARTGGVRRRRAIAVLGDRVVLGVVADDPGAPERLDVNRRCGHQPEGTLRLEPLQAVLSVATTASAA
jgi:hypothetical protein